MAAKARSNELKITRVYDAPVKTVWDAWTDPKQVEKWWGPRGFTLTTHGKDLRAGGYWEYTMHGPDGTDFPNKTIYHEVVRHSRLVYDHGGNDGRPPLFRVSVNFTEIRGKTRMEMTMTLATPEAAEQIAGFIKKAGGNATWDRLAEFLAKETTGREQFVINRSFDSPVSTVFAMWTGPEHLSRWLPPTGFTMTSDRAEAQPDGSVSFTMTDGKLTLASAVTFEEEPNGQTRVTVISEPQGMTGAEQLENFVRMRGSMTKGWSGAFDRLEELLSS